jgi:hypothetical protein
MTSPDSHPATNRPTGLRPPARRRPVFAADPWRGAFRRHVVRRALLGFGLPLGGGFVLDSILRGRSLAEALHAGLLLRPAFWGALALGVAVFTAVAAVVLPPAADDPPPEP